MFGMFQGKNKEKKVTICDLIKEDGSTLIDVRSRREYQNGCLPGSVNMPLEQLMKKVKKIKKNKAIVLYCASGVRSSVAQQQLLQLGYTKVYNLGGYGNYNCG